MAQQFPKTILLNFSKTEEDHEKIWPKYFQLDFAEKILSAKKICFLSFAKNFNWAFFISNFRVKPVERRFDTWKRWKRRLGLISNSKIANFYLNATNHTENIQSKYEFVQEIMSWTKTRILKIDLSLNKRLDSKAYNNELKKWCLERLLIMSF